MPRGGARAGAGRPREIHDGTTVCVRLPDDVLQKIDSLRGDMSRSEAIRDIIREYIARRK